MATYSTGITLSFDDSDFEEVVGLSWSYGSGLPKGRGSKWTDDLGEVSVELLGGISTGAYGNRGELVIEGGGVDLTCMAVCTSVGVAAELNGVTRYSATFKILDE